MSIRNSVVKTFPYLFEQAGFVFLENRPEDGEMVAVAQSGSMLLRFIQDRADFFLDVGDSRKPDEWIGFYDILDEMSRKGMISESYKYANKIDTLSRLLRRTLPLARQYLSLNAVPTEGES